IRLVEPVYEAGAGAEVFDHQDSVVAVGSVQARSDVGAGQKLQGGPLIQEASRGGLRRAIVHVISAKRFDNDGWWSVGVFSTDETARDDGTSANRFDRIEWQQVGCRAPGDSQCALRGGDGVRQDWPGVGRHEARTITLNQSPEFSG